MPATSLKVYRILFIGGDVLSEIVFRRDLIHLVLEWRTRHLSSIPDHLVTECEDCYVGGWCRHCAENLEMRVREELLQKETADAVRHLN